MRRPEVWLKGTGDAVEWLLIVDGKARRRRDDVSICPDRPDLPPPNPSNEIARKLKMPAS